MGHMFLKRVKKYCPCGIRDICNCEERKVNFEKQCKLLKENNIPFTIFNYEVIVDQHALLKDLEFGKLKVILNQKAIGDDQDLIFNLSSSSNNK